MTQTFLIQNGDVVIGATGQPTMVADGVKLRQDVQENLSISVQSTGFGAGLDDLVGILGDEFSLRAKVAQRVRTSIGAMLLLQNQYHRAQRPLTERIARIGQILVSSVGGKKSTFLFKVDVMSAAGLTASTTGILGG